MSALQTFEASLRHAVRERQAATVGGGHFTHQELEEVLSEIEALRNAKTQLEAMVGQVLTVVECVEQPHDARAPALLMVDGPLLPIGTKLYTAAPVAQQYEAGDVATAAAQGFRDGVASVQQGQEPVVWLVCSVNSDGSLSLEHAAAWKEAAHEHINDAITEHGIEEAASWVVRPAYVATPVAQHPQTEPDDEILKERDDVEDFIDMLLDEVLGTDRPEWTSAYGRDDALRDVQERMTALHKPTVDKAWDRFEKAQQPQAEPRKADVARTCPFCNEEWVEQPQAEADIHEAQGQIEFLDRKNNALSAAIRKVMARLADLLDEDQFKEIEETISSAGVQPQAEAVQCSVNSVSSRMCEKGTNGCDTQHAPQQAEAVPLTHVLVPVDEPTDEMVDAACAAVDGLCRVDFVRAYVAAFAHLKAGYRDESYWCGWNAAIKFQQAESAHQYNLANRLRVHLANRHTLTGPEFKDGVAGILAEYYTAPQQAEAVPTFDEQLREVAKRAIPQQAEAVPFNHATQLQIAYVKGLGDGAMQAEAVPPDAVRDAERLDWLLMQVSGKEFRRIGVEYSGNCQRADIDAAIAQQKGGV